MAGTRRLVLDIGGADCATCVKIIGKALKGQPGVVDVRANYVANVAVVDYDPDATTERAIEERLRERTSLAYRRRPG